MTDGEATYPAIEINDLLNKPYINKVYFNAIAYGDAQTDTIQ